MSLPVFARGKTLGVVNVEVNQTNAFGRTEGEQEAIVEQLIPFCSLLGYLCEDGPRGGESYGKAR
jgi:hypothetical protein